MAGQVMRQLIDRRGREAVACLQQTEEVIAVGHQPVVVHARVALVNGHSIGAMALADLSQTLSYQFEGLIPANWLPFIAATEHRVAQAIGVALNVLQRHRLRTDMATAEAVEGVALDREDLLAFGLDGHATD